MKQKRVTTDDLFDIMDLITKVSAQAERCSQMPVAEALKKALPMVSDAARHTSYNEALDRRRLSDMHSSTDSEKLTHDA